MKIDGGCHCGGIRYEAEIDPAKVVICHCTDCQTLSGSAFRMVAQTLPGSFRLLAGALKVYVKTGESGNQRQQTFCPDCGTPIYSAPISFGVGDDATVVGLRVGSVRQRDQLIPSDQYWFRSSQAWLPALPTIKKQDKQPVFDPKGAFGDS
ncbi:MAG: GFA family protein [Alphaproteobacteria bacterium]